jgi:hypothetical protein
MDCCKEAQIVNGTGSVLPVPFSHKDNAVGIHWLRISFSKQHLANLTNWLSKLWGDFQADGFGLWSYDSRLSWSNGCSLNYDEDDERSNRVHLGMMTLDCPGSALDELSIPDLQLLCEFAHAFNGKCSRIDCFYDDYARRVYPSDLDEVIKRNDFSGLRHAGLHHKWDNGHLIREEVSFGERGSRGNGKYLRFYNKELESDGEQKCNRWEVEFTRDKAQQVFLRLAKTAGNLEAFASITAALVAGSITFVHRTGEKNISRLELYDWWKDIRDVLGGCVTIRTSRKKDSLTGKMNWVTRNVSPSLACLKKVFVSDRVFLRWLFDVCRDGEGRQNKFTQRLAEDNEAALDYEHGRLLTNTGVPYECRVS